MEELSIGQQRKAGYAKCAVSGQLPEYMSGVATSVMLSSPLNWEVTYVDYSAFEKGSAFGTGAEKFGEYTPDPHMAHRGVSKGRSYVAQATLKKGEGDGLLIFPF
jgi:hypothetical protein